MNTSLEFRAIETSDIQRCFELESASYPPDEAATLEKLTFRQKEVSDAFRGAWLEDRMIGFVCSTRCSNFDHASMSSHNPTGAILSIHSVAIDERFRRKGYATQMLKNYVSHFDSTGGKLGIETLMLIAKARLLTFYIACGFRVNGISPIEHGQDIWYELEHELPQTKKLPYWVVDAFTECYGAGNPAAVVKMMGRDASDQEDKTIEWRQTVSREFNLSETAFLWRRTQGDAMHEYDIRYYTGTGVEIPLCGHATLASATALFQSEAGMKSVTFHTADPTIKLMVDKCLQSETAPLSIIRSSMTFPWKEVANFPDHSESQTCALEMLMKSINLGQEHVLFLGVGEGQEDLFVEVTTAAFHKLPTTKDVLFEPLVESTLYSRGFIICCKSDIQGIDFLSRFFGPKVGILEDPVTGSAHCLLAPYFGKLLGKTNLIGKQMSLRQGELECELLNVDSTNRRVKIKGSAVVFMAGNLWV